MTKVVLGLMRKYPAGCSYDTKAAAWALNIEDAYIYPIPVPMPADPKTNDRREQPWTTSTSHPHDLARDRRLSAMANALVRR